MHTGVRSSGIIVTSLLLFAGRLTAQCPDGTPPPCHAAAAPTARGPLDANLIAIFPFRITGTSSEASSLREGAMDLLALALDEQAGLRVVPSRTLLARTRTFTDASPVSDALGIARGLGAGVVILGNAVVIGGQLRAHADLHDVLHDRSISSVDARGLASDPAPVIDSLAAGLARVRLAGAGQARRSIQEFASTSPQALRAYLAGERLGRQGRWLEAADSLSLAIQMDSTFGLAYYRLSVVSRYSVGAVLPVRDPIPSALRFQSRLPRRQLELLRTVYAAQRGELREALSLADATAAAYPDDPEVAFEQGEAYFHTGMSLGGPWEPAKRAFARAVALDSAMLEPYNHLIELLILDGDTTTAWRLTERAHAMAPNAPVQLACWYLMRILRGEAPETVGREAIAASGTQGVTRTYSEISRDLNADPARAVALMNGLIASIGSDAPPSLREQAQAAHWQFLVAQGQMAAARPLSTAANLPVLDAVAGHPAAPQASAGRMTYADAWNAVLVGDSSWKSGAISLRQTPPPADAFGEALALSLEGFAAVRRGDSAEARAKFARIAEVKPFASTSELAWGSIIELARLERAAGMLDAAMGHLRDINFFNGFTLERAQAEELKGQIAEQQGDTATAIRSYRNFVGLWEHADPEYQPRVTAARAALARLEHR